MNTLLFTLQVAVVAFSVVSANRRHCDTIECGSSEGWISKPRKSWTLSPGPYSTEVVPSGECLVGGIMGFTATVCLDSDYPTLRCEGDDRVYVDKNGARSGRIDVIPYCNLL